MAKVGIVMGSDSDMPVMAKAAEILDQLGIDYEMTIISAHREPDIFFQWAKSAEEKGFKVIIAGAGKAAHLPGMCAAVFPLPVIAPDEVGENGYRYYTRDRYSYEDLRPGRRRFPLFHRTDAKRHSRCHCSHQRRSQCRHPCGKDPCCF